MSNQAIEYEFEIDSEPMKNHYVVENTEWLQIQDNNSLNYDNATINFNSVNVSGTNPNIQVSLANAYVTIPYTIDLVATGCTFTQSNDNVTVVPANKNACSVKGFHHFLDKSYAKMGSTSLYEELEYSNIIINENLKKMSADEKLLFGNKLNFELDSVDSFKYNPLFVGESNNKYSSAFDHDANVGHLKRMKNTNGYHVNDSYKLVLGDNATNESLQCKMVTNTATKLQFSGVATIPLSQIHPIFKEMPTMSSIKGMELRLRTNLTKNNSWTVFYTGLTATDSEFPLIGVESSQSQGNTCPILFSNAGSSNGATPKFGLTLKATTNNTECSVKCSVKIGYTNTGTTGSNQEPCYLYIPTYNMTPSYANKVLNSPQFRLLHNDYATTWFRGRYKSNAISEQFQGSHQRLRKIHIIPFFSGKNVTGNFNGQTAPTMLEPYKSLVSSAPTTCSPCRITDFNIKIGAKSVFGAPLKYSHEFYEQHKLHLQGKVNGNSSKQDALFSGLISKEMFDKCYGVYTFNLQLTTNEALDDEPKDIFLTWKTNVGDDAGSAIKYDFLVILEKQKEINLDRSTGMFALKSVV